MGVGNFEFRTLRPDGDILSSSPFPFRPTDVDPNNIMPDAANENADDMITAFMVSSARIPSTVKLLINMSRSDTDEDISTTTVVDYYYDWARRAEINPGFISYTSQKYSNVNVSNSIESPKDAINKIMLYLGLNVSELATILHISRPTIYSWSEGKTPKSESDRRRLYDISSIADEWNRISSFPIGEALKWPIINNKNIFDMLSEDDLKLADIKESLEPLNARITSEWADTDIYNTGMSSIPDHWKLYGQRNIVKQI